MSCTITGAGLLRHGRVHPGHHGPHRHRDGHFGQDEARLKAVLENAPAEIYLKDRDGPLHRRQPHLRAALGGHATAELQGRLPEEVHGQAVHAEQDRAHDMVVLTSGEPVEQEQDVHLVDGWHTRRLIKFPIRDQNGDIIGLGAIGIDVTSQKTMERANQQAREEAEHANRAKTEFLANMSHELRSPLNSIVGFSELIKNEAYGPHSDRRYGEFASDILESGQHLLELINDILDLSKIEARGLELQEEVIDAADLLGAVQRMLAERAERDGLEMTITWQGELPKLRGDRRKLKQVLINLLTNAIKFTEAGGSVRLQAWCRDSSGFVFQVVDSGIGIPLEDIPKALSQFGQVDSPLSHRDQGTGLGLPLSKALIELHGGSLDLQSKVGVGTTVTVRLPAERVLSEAEANARLLA